MTFSALPYMPHDLENAHFVVEKGSSFHFQFENQIKIHLADAVVLNVITTVSICNGKSKNLFPDGCLFTPCRNGKHIRQSFVYKGDEFLRHAGKGAAHMVAQKQSGQGARRRRSGHDCDAQ